MESNPEKDSQPGNVRELDFDDEILRAIAEVHKNGGNDEFNKKEYRNAINTYTEGINVNCKDEQLNAKLYSNRATAHFRLGNYEECLNDVRATVELQPGFIKAMARGASACMELGLYEEVITWCNMGLAINKKCQTLLDLRNKCVYQRNKVQETKGEFKFNSTDMESSPEKDSQPGNVRELDFDNETLRAIAEVHKNGGNDEFNKKEYRNAINSYTEGINVNCKDEQLNAKLYSNRATAHFRLGNYQECLNDVKATVELQPEFIKAMARGASACMELGLYEEAITWCNKGLAINKNSRTLLDLRNKSAYQRNKVQESTGEKVHGYPQRQIVYLKRCAKTVKDRTKEEGGCTGIAFRSLEESRRAKHYYEHRLKIAQQVTDKFGKGSEYCNLGNVYSSLNNFQKAIKCHERSLEISKEIKDRSSEGRAYCNLGLNFGNLREFKKAIEFLDLARKIATDLNDSIEEARACHNLGTVYCKLKQFKKALDYHERCLKIAKQVEDRTGEGHSYCNLGTDYLGLRDLKKALEYLKCGLNILREVEDKYGQERAYRGIGAVYNNLKDFKTAIYYLKSCIKISKEVGDRLAECLAYDDLGKAYAGLQDFKNAIHYHDRCLQIAKEDGGKYVEAIPLSNLGNVYRSMKHFDKSIDCFENCLKIAKVVKDMTLEEDTYLDLHTTYNNLGDWKKCRYYLELRLKVAKDQEHRINEGETYFLLGNECCRLRNVEEAIGFLKRSQDVATEVGERELEAAACNNLGTCYDNLGNFREAKDCNERCLRISKEIGDKRLEKSGYHGLGNAYISLGDLKKAIECFQRSLQIDKELGDSQAAEGNHYAYCGLGNTYCILGDYKRAIYYDERCLDIAKQLGDRCVESIAYGNLANAYLQLQDFKTAIKYNEYALAIAIEQEHKHGQINEYRNLGNIYSSLGENGKAMKYFELSLKIAKETKDRSAEGRSYGNIGLCHCRMGNFVKAKEYQKRHVEIALELDEMEEVSVAYGNLAISLEYLGFGHDAIACYKSSIKAYEAMRSCLQSNDEWKVTFSDKLQGICSYTSLSSLLLRMGKSVEALCAAENGRAQALNDLLHSNYGIRAANNTKSSIEEETIQYIFRGIHCDVIFPLFLHCFIAFWVIQKGNHVSSRAKEVTYPGTREDVVNYVQKLVESTPEVLGVGSDMNCEDRSLDRLKNPSSAEKRYNQTVQHSLESQNHHLKRLYDFFIAPVADLIHVEEIVIVPEGPLLLAPFAAFMDSNSKFLSDSFRIRVIPSLTSLRLILDCPADYHSKTGVLLVGDPWVQDITVDEGGKLDQLPYAKKEVEMIGRILNATPLTGKEATKVEVLKRLSSVALVHIAAHGRMETGEIALCPNPCRTSLRPEDEDFILSMRDVLNVKLRAKLVVLSCCHSGRGEIKAEGVVGIARAFMGAGARSVLVSLWAIDDEATLEFMKTFYQHLAEGKGASESLNRAMKSIRESERFSDVKYWAPFVLIGDDVSLEFAKND